jgi:biotin operon repressor
MKEYRLTAWPDLDPTHDRTRFRRLLSDMSHRYMSVAQLADRSGLRRPEVRRFVEQLQRSGQAIEREATEPDSLFGSLRPLGGWLARTFDSASARR